MIKCKSIPVNTFTVIVNIINTNVTVDILDIMHNESNRLIDKTYDTADEAQIEYYKYINNYTKN